MLFLGPLLALQYFFADSVGGIFRFPLWWYTRGLAGVARWAGGSVKNQARNLGLSVWMKNLFNPMYGTTDLAGKLISFFLRAIIIAAQSLALGAWVLVVCAAVAGFLVSLPLALLGMLYHLRGLLL
jgi:hypothetical protein